LANAAIWTGWTHHWLMLQHGPNEAPICSLANVTTRPQRSSTSSHWPMPLHGPNKDHPSRWPMPQHGHGGVPLLSLADAATRLQRSSTSRWPMPQRGSNGVLHPVGRRRNAAPTEFHVLLADAATWLQRSSMTFRWPTP
jgi:hypothetical protein